MQYSTKKLAEHKLIILHLLQKMGISLSNSEICQFLLEKNYMDYFSVQQYLAELESAGWLEKTREQNNTRYTLTDDGEEVINYFINRISDEVKNEINVYVHEKAQVKLDITQAKQNMKKLEKAVRNGSEGARGAFLEKQTA